MTLFQQKINIKAISLIVIILFLFSFIPVNAQNDFPPSITSILVTNQESREVREPDLGVSRIQNVQVNTAVLDQIIEEFVKNPDITQRIRFDVFDNLSFTASINKKESTLDGGYILSGYLEDTREGRITLVSNRGTISAILTDYTTQYQLKKNFSGFYQFEEIDQSAFPNELEPIIPQSDTINQSSFDNEATTELDSGAIIDLMVVYTDDSRLNAGGTTNMVNLINLAVSETNNGYERSNIIQRMNLVHTAEVSYADDSSFNWNTALNNLTNNDGVIDEVRLWRDTYGADLVVLIVNNVTYCGIGWLMTPTYTYDSVGFSVVSRSCATGYYSLAHETGHNMGAHHDRANASGTAMYSYSYGYQAPNFAFRTIMSYNCSTYCPRINNWSNPEIYYGGLPTGVNYLASNSADNRMTLNNTAGIVANFRQSRTIPSSPTNLLLASRNMTSIGMQFSDTSINETGFKIERSINGGAWIQINSLLANQTSYLDTGLTCNVNYAYRVRAYNQSGDSTYSNILNSSTTACVPPTLPSNIQTIISLSTITLNWEDVENESSYIIEESVDDAKSWNLIAVLDENVTTYTVTGLTPGATYSIRLSVENAYGLTMSEPILFTTMTHAIFIPMLKN